MSQNYKIKDTFKNLSFYSDKIKKLKTRPKFLDFYLSYHSFLKNLKN